MKEETVFIAEGNTQGTSSSVELLKNLGLFDDVSLTADMANEVENSDGVYFIPAFSGLQAPINDHHAVPILIGNFSYKILYNFAVYTQDDAKAIFIFPWLKFIDEVTENLKNTYI